MICVYINEGIHIIFYAFIFNTPHIHLFSPFILLFPFFSSLVSFPVFLFFYPRYGAQHPIVVLQKTPSTTTGKYVVVGHCCESGDLFSCAPGEPEVIAERLLVKPEVCECFLFLCVRACMLYIYLCLCLSFCI